MTSSAIPASFRDPSGFLFERGGTLLRQINHGYREHYDRLMDSGLYDELCAAGLLIPHSEVDQRPAAGAAYKVIAPTRVPFVSYPYEWSFSQLKDAALTTLAIQRRALAHDMTLKDASAYNIQFHRGRPLLIDTLSFECYAAGEPWVAYRQFCQHFLAPLALMGYRDVRLSGLLRVHIDGIPLGLASRLLPWRSRLRFPLLTHLHLHAATQRRYADRRVGRRGGGRRLSRRGFIGILDSLTGGIQRLAWQAGGTEWADYYTATNYSPSALAEKEALVADCLEAAAPAAVWDLGANTGRFSRLAAARDIPTVAFDIDPAAVDRNYREVRRRGEQYLLPLVLDLTNPSPGLGWAHRERAALMDRGPVDAVLALALVHHLAISNNVPLPHLAEFFHRLGGYLIVEFVPKSDSQVQRLLATRADVFPDYHTDGFRQAFRDWFSIEREVPIPESKRTLFLMRPRTDRP